jgi:hypothetical protein
MSQSGKSLTYGAMLAHGWALFRIPLWGLIAIVAGGITLAGFAVHGFDENGLRFGNQLAWRFASLVYVAAIIAGPASRLVPSIWLRRAGKQRHQLVWGFCASFGVYLASLIVPNTFMPASLDHQGLTFGMVLFASFGAALTMVVAYAVSPGPKLGEQSRRAILGVGLAYFWLAYSLTDLSRLSGPPDPFYGASLILMFAALLVRFADNFGARLNSARRSGSKRTE